MTADPSSGGTGIRLNAASIDIGQSEGERDLDPQRASSTRQGGSLEARAAAMSAIEMFTAGPARLTSIDWLRGSRSRRTFTGTGLA